MVIIKIVMLAIIGALAYNPTLEKVAYNRQFLPTENPISREVVISDYECLLAVPYGFEFLIGEEGWFYDVKTKKYYGPYLIVDVEKEEDFWKHSMVKRGLVGDINCTFLVHKRGKIATISRTYQAPTYTHYNLHNEHNYLAIYLP